jgi:hypothetical protein
MQKTIALMLLLSAVPIYSAEPVTSPKLIENERAALIHLTIEIVAAKCGASVQEQSKLNTECKELIESIPLITECLRLAVTKASTEKCKIQW